MKEEIENHADEKMAPNVVIRFENHIESLKVKIAQVIMDKVTSKLALKQVPTDPNYTDENIIFNYGAFAAKQNSELHNCSMLLVRKSIPKDSEEKVGSSLESGHSTRQVEKPREQVYLEKTKPPRFNGDNLEFPEFQRKWESQVNKANLPEETELDKLRDALPKDAKDQLYGVTKLDEAWKILSKRFGDKDLISKKLKDQLKNVKCEGKTDADKVISLQIKVKTIATRLEILNMGAALTHDSEFLSAVYCALPSR